MMLTDSPAYAAGMLLAGLAAGMAWYGLRLKKHGMPVGTALWTAALGSLLALICAKAGYLLHDLGANLLDGYYDEIWSLTAETFSFAGGCAGFAAGAALAAKISVIRPGEALDLLAAPGCVFICLARLAEGGMYNIGLGGEVTAEWLRFFPLTMKNSWGDAYLSVFLLEALWALVCLIPALKREERQVGLTCRRTAIWLLGGQTVWEMLLQYPYIRSLYTSFVSLDQVICAVILLGITIFGCVRNRRWLPAVLMVLTLGVSAFFQFFREKPDLFTESLPVEAADWFMDASVTLSVAAFFVIAGVLILLGERAVSPADAGKTEKM